MAGKHVGRPSWMDPDFYPFKDKLVKDAKTEHESVFLVDIGGGKGHDLQEMHGKHPEIPGKLVLQDVKGVIEEAEASGLDVKIVPMEHDFFTKQPITGMSVNTAGKIYLLILADRCQGLLHAFLSS